MQAFLRTYEIAFGWGTQCFKLEVEATAGTAFTAATAAVASNNVPWECYSMVEL
jgi:hypothetical protein